MKLNLILSLFILGLCLVACGDEEEPASCDTSAVTYTNSISAIFNASCATTGCHVDGNEAAALFSLNGYEKSKLASEGGRIVGSINHDDNFSAMPRGGDKLAACDIDKVTAWIAAGSPE